MRSVLVISTRDNVATALEALGPGRVITVSGSRVTIREPIPSGHKVALARIPAGEAVMKYGSPIGLATVDILPGAHVHVHNVSSSRGRGDLDPPATDGPQPRLAEPPDERNGATSQPSTESLSERRTPGRP